MRHILATIAVLAASLLSGCVQTLAPPIPSETRAEAEVAVSRFVAVAQRMEPVIETQCHKRAPHRNCDYRIVVADRVDLPPNAFEFEGPKGRPMIGVTLSMIGAVKNPDEMAFVLGHEAAHHIAGHIEQRTLDAQQGAEMVGLMVAARGADRRTVARAREIGAEIGARMHARDYELEADRLGTIITWDAGYDPLKGAAFFARLPDPGETVLGTHPANALRLDVVRAEVRKLRKAAAKRKAAATG